MLNVIIDTNILISGLLKSPSCRKIIKLLEEKRFTLVTSPVKNFHNIPIIISKEFLSHLKEK